MPKASVFLLDDSRSVSLMGYCVDGLHVLSVGDGGTHAPTQRKVKPCDKTCEQMPTLKEVELPDGFVKYLRKQSGTESATPTS